MTAASLYKVLGTLLRCLGPEFTEARVTVEARSPSGETYTFACAREAPAPPPPPATAGVSETPEEPSETSVARPREKGPRLTRRDAARIKRRISEGERNILLARDYGCSEELISGIRHARCWRHVEAEGA